MRKRIEAWEQDALLPLAQQRIELDLDDDVKVMSDRFALSQGQSRFPLLATASPATGAPRQQDSQ